MPALLAAPVVPVLAPEPVLGLVADPVPVVDVPAPRPRPPWPLPATVVPAPVLGVPAASVPLLWPALVTTGLLALVTTTFGGVASIRFFCT